MPRRNQLDHPIQIIGLIQQVLTPDLLQPKYRRQIKPGDHKTKGHCYVATEALYHLWGKRAGYKPHVVRLDKDTTHWFLQHPTTGRVIDPTVEQVPRKNFSYWWGRRNGFLTGDKPSKRCKIVLERIKRLETDNEKTYRKGVDRSNVGNTLLGTGKTARRSSTPTGGNIAHHSGSGS